MSEEFFKVAKLEINQELKEIKVILKSCLDDADVAKNSNDLEQHMHKIKGLAPMMGKEDVGSLAKTLDLILKKLVIGKKINGFIGPLNSSIDQMIFAMDKQCDLSSIQKQISDISLKIID